MGLLHTASRFSPTRSDGAALALVCLAATLIRLLFLFRAPPFYVGGDSPTYLQPAVDLLLGRGFDPIVKRPPGYPLFVAGALYTLGWDLQGLNLLQHVLGVATAAATWAMGRLLFGRLAGLLAGLLIASNGTLLIYEHYVMAEALFICLVALGLFTTLRAAKRPSTGRLALAGLLIGLASATRQTAQPLLLLVPLALLLGGQRLGAAARGTVVALVGFAVVLVPWLAFDYLRHQTLASGTLGETLVWRLTRSNSDDEFFKQRLSPVADQRLHEARRFAWGQAADRVLPSDTKVALQQRFGLTELQADALLRTLAFEAIAAQPLRYLGSSASLMLEHLLGTEQFLGGQGKSGGVKRYSDVETKYSSWWSEQTRPLIQNATPPQEQEFRRAQLLANLFQPHRFGWPLLGLFVAGLLAVLLRPSWRLGLVPGLAALVLILLVSFLGGDLPRYRYPAEPALAVVQAGGLLWLAGLPASAAGWLFRRRSVVPSASAAAHQEVRPAASIGTDAPAASSAGPRISG